MKNRAPDSLKAGIGWMFAGQCGGYLLRVIYFILIARALGVVEYGAVAAAFAFVSLGAQYSRLGSGMVLLRYVSAERPQFSVYWGNVLITTLAASAVITVAFWLLAPHILDVRSVGLVAFTSAASCVFEQITISTTQVFQAFQRMGLTAGLNLLTSLLRTVAAAGLLITVKHATALEWVVLSMIVSALASVIGVVAVTIHFGLPRVDMNLFRVRFGEGLEYSFAASTNSAYDDLDKTMLSHFGMTGAVGIYAMAYRVIEMATVPITSIQLAAEPRQFAFGREGVHDSAALGRRLLYRSLLMSLATAVILFVAAPLLTVMVGKNFGEAVSALRWLCLIPLFRSIHHLTGSVLTCSGRQRIRTTNQFTAALLNFLLNLWLIPLFGWRGAAWASLATDGSLGIMNWLALNFVLSKSKSSHVSNVLASDVPALVSVIIPYFKQDRYLPLAVRSVKNLSYHNVEVIVVDDGSPVAATTLLHGFEGVKIIRTNNRGVSAARNLGVQYSSGEYLIFLDADDAIESSAIDSHMEAMANTGGAALSFGAMRVMDENGRIAKHLHICRPRKSYLRCLLASNPIGCPGAAMIRRSAFQRVGGFDESFSRAEDYLLFLKIALRENIVRTGACVVSYRKHSEGASRDMPAMLASTMAALDVISVELNSRDRNYLRHARKRWRHAYEGTMSVGYLLNKLYFKACAMLTVPVSAYFNQE